MNLSSEVKKKAFTDHGKSEFDTGSAEAQIALFTMKKGTNRKTKSSVQAFTGAMPVTRKKMGEKT